LLIFSAFINNILFMNVFSRFDRNMRMGLTYILAGLVVTYCLVRIAKPVQRDPASAVVSEAGILNPDRVRQFGRAPVQSAWDGAYQEVENFLRQNTANPDSLLISTCTELKVDDNAGWLVGCDYRGKNMSGALSLESKWFVIRHGSVVRALPIEAYPLKRPSDR